MRPLFIFAALLTLLAGCGKTGYRYAKSGMKYKIIDGGKKDTLRHGDMIKMFVESRLEDSVMQSSKDLGYQLFVYDSNMAKQEYNASEIFPILKIGDSAVCVFKSDSIIRKQFGENPPPGSVPPFLKKGQHFYMFIRIVQKYSDTASFNAARQQEMEVMKNYQAKMQKKQEEDQAKKDAEGFKVSHAAFDKFMAGKTDKMTKTAGGSYIEILEPGTGMPCDSGKQVAIRYRGSVMNGEEFETNFNKPTDTVQKPPFEVVLGQSPTIRGFDEGIRALRGGSRAKIYIPAESGYGGMAQGPKIKAFSNLVFEVFIENVSKPKPVANIQQQPNPNYNPQNRGGGAQAQPGHEGHNH
jgi:FKBP-type peptidyl-prolyl cis-trans isomerase FkpA